MRPWKGTIVEEIFSDFCISTDFDISIEKLQGESYKMMEYEPSRNRSNMNGWQSPMYNDLSSVKEEPISQIFPEFTKLNYLINDFSTEMVHQEKLVVGSKFAEIKEWWLNKNDYQSYNHIHIHGRADLIGVFYVKSPKDSSCIRVVRNDGSSYAGLYRDNLTLRYSQSVPYPPIEGKFYLFPGHLWHYVCPQTVEGDRISSSYNIFLKA